MPRPNTLTLAVRDLCDDIAYHTVNLANGAFDLACVAAVAALIYASSLDTASRALASRPSADAHTVKACTPAKADCIAAHILAPLDA